MSIDVLQNKIRKLKNPSAVILAPGLDQIPETFGTGAAGAGEYCCRLLDALKDIIPAVRVSFAAFALLGVDGLAQLQRVMKYAAELGYYVILDWMQLEKVGAAEQSAKLLLEGEDYPCDGITLCGYAGSDCIKPYMAAAAGKKQDVFVVLKTANRSAMEIQDLQTGGRTVHTAAADFLNRWGETAMERCGYSRLAAMAGANNAVSLRNLRQKYPRMFLLVDGLDVTGANSKNASEAFDRLGHGALCCSGSSIIGAWKDAEPDADPIVCAVEAAERMKRNLSRYILVL